MIRERVRGASVVSALLRELAEGIAQGHIRISDEEFDVGRNVVAVADAYPGTGELLIVIAGIAPVVSDAAGRDEAEYELAYSSN